MSIEVMTKVWRYGPAKAPDLLMLLSLADFADEHGLSWPSMRTLAEKCRVTVDTARTTVRRLETDGWLETRIGGGTADGRGQPNRYQIALWRLTPPSTGETPVERPPSPPSTTPPSPPPTGAEPSVEPPVRQPPVTHAAVAAEGDQPFDGVLVLVPAVEETGPAKTAQTLVARWCDGYRAEHAGADAPGPLMKRVAGQARNLARSCESDDDWRAAWFAAYAAGEHGRPDAVPFMVEVKSRFAATGPRNVLLDPHLMDSLPAVGGAR